MQNKKHGNSHWKDKLEDTAGFSSSDLPDTGAAWDKLYKRLHQPRRKNNGWYWVAAASILTGIIFTIIFSQQRQTGVSNTVKTTPQKQPGRLINAVKENETAATAAAGNKEKAIKTMHGNKTGLQSITVIPGQKIQLTLNNDNKITAPSTALLPFEIKPLNDTVSSAPLASTQPKAKLKVVHVNELGDAGNDQYNNQPAVDYSVIQFGVGSQKIYNKTSLPSGKIGLNISTGKTSPSN